MRIETTPSRKRLAWISFSLILAALLTWSALPRFSYSTSSPGGAYRIDFYQSSLLQRLAHREERDPGFVRLYRNRDNQKLGESSVVDLFGNGDVRWMLTPTGEISVGMDVRLSNLPPE